MKPFQLFIPSRPDPQAAGATYEQGSGHPAFTRSGVTVFGAFRLKNGRALIDALELPASATDSELLVSGWQRWGVDLADKLRGSFALVIADSARGEIYAARDIFGLEPLYLAKCEDGWLLGGSPRNVRKALPTPPALNRLRIADYITDRVVEQTETFFEGVERHPVGTWSLIDRAGRKTSRFWSATMAPRAFDGAEPVVAFRNLFDSAVDFSTDRSAPLGAFVSGGMDSSAILASVVARHGSDDLVGLSRTYRELPSWSDGEYIDLVKARLDLQVVEVPGEDIDPLENAELVLEACDGPVQSYGMAAIVRLHREARSRGVRVILDGHGGDEIVSYGFGRLNELARAGQWRTMWRETEAASRMFGMSRFRLALQYFDHQPLWHAVRRRLRRLRRPADLAEEQSPLSAALQEIVEPDRYARNDPHYRRAHDERLLQEHALDNPLQQYSQEVLTLVSRSNDIDCRMPFYDRELAEFSLSLPSDQKLRDGLTRVILRDSLRDRLPKKLLDRAGKFDFSYAFAKGLLQPGARALDLADPENPTLTEYVNRDWLVSLRSRIGSDPGTVGPYDARSLFRIAQLALWLDEVRDEK